VNERVHTFGSHHGLVGILTEPLGDGLRPGAPAVLFSNIGLNHRVGPNRLYVELARKLAACGFRSLRFDLSGFGDSAPRRGGGTDLERATLDTREAMDFLAKRGIDRFVLVGLCSGVDSAHRAALQDARVVGAIFIDGYTYRNMGFWLRFWTVRNAQPARWRRFVRIRLARLLGNRPMRDMDDLPEIFERQYPARQQFASDLAALHARSLKMLFVYTINEDGSYNYRNQFHDMFGYRGEIDVEYFTRADHVFSTEEHRQHLLSRMVQWLDDRFPRTPYVPSAQHAFQAVARHASRPAIYIVGPAAVFSFSRLLRLVAESDVISVALLGALSA
jgi:pimeloyl-ACP methyl ester carboxylesterase